MPLHPCKESLDDPASLITTQPPSGLRRAFDAVRLMRRDLSMPLANLGIKWIAVLGTVADQNLRLGCD